jgi:hypothetical protein
MLVGVPIAAETVALNPEDQQIHPPGMLPPYRGFGESQVATALVAMPASLAGRHRAASAQGRPVLQPIEVLGITKREEARLARR